MTTCVLMQNGLSVSLGNKVGVCCYNRNNPSKYSTYDIDPVGCSACIDQERNGIKSYRQGANERYGIEQSHQNPIVLDVTPNFNCNLTCKICNEKSSSSWAKLKKIKIQRSYNISQSQFKTTFDNLDLSYVREINFSGGEPLLNNNIIKYIGSLEDKIDFAKCTLRFSTNGTQLLTDKLVDFFLKFKLVLARFSLDDIEEGFEYQRYPANWKAVQSNWVLFLNTMPHNVIPSINRTVSILNIHRLHQLDAWHALYPTTQFGDPIELLDHFVFGEYGLHSMPPGLKEHIKLSGHNRAWSYVKNRPTTTNIAGLRDAIQTHDKNHNTSLRDYDTELYNIIFE
jgi:hypothetical protein